MLRFDSLFAKDCFTENRTSIVHAVPVQIISPSNSCFHVLVLLLRQQTVKSEFQHKFVDILSTCTTVETIIWNISFLKRKSYKYVRLDWQEDFVVIFKILKYEQNEIKDIFAI